MGLPSALGALVLLCYLSDVTTQEIVWLTCWGALHIKCWMGRYSYPKCNNGEKEHTNIILPSALHFPIWEQMNVMNIHSFAKQGCSFRSQESEWSPSGESTPLALRILGGKLPSVGANPALLGDKIKRHLPGKWKEPVSSEVTMKSTWNLTLTWDIFNHHNESTEPRWIVGSVASAF